MIFLPSLTPKFRGVKLDFAHLFTGSFVALLLKLCFTHFPAPHLPIAEHQSRAGFFTPRISIAFTASENNHISKCFKCDSRQKVTLKMLAG